ncbi:MAG: hypothetical protein E7K47_05750 [Acidovorax sp.]|nr:hypothetical protein [Acidovorax sp.]
MSSDQVITPCGTTLRRVRALRDIPMYGVKAGDLGGYIESEANLSQSGDCWVGGQARVWQGARVNDCAIIKDHAQASGNAALMDFALMDGYTTVTDFAQLRHWAAMTDRASASGGVILENSVRAADSSIVRGLAHLSGDVRLFDSAQVYGKAHLRDRAWAFGFCRIGGEAQLSGSVMVFASARIAGRATLMGDVCVFGEVSISGDVVLDGMEQIGGNAIITDGWYGVTDSLTRQVHKERLSANNSTFNFKIRHSLYGRDNLPCILRSNAL